MVLDVNTTAKLMTGTTGSKLFQAMTLWRPIPVPAWLETLVEAAATAAALSNTWLLERPDTVRGPKVRPNSQRKLMAQAHTESFSSQGECAA
jgi:hypothetical protein